MPPAGPARTPLAGRDPRSPRLLRTAYLLCRDWAQAEDLLQTALVRVWRAWGRVGEHPDA
ncbi:sigma factor [Nonomuraea wenchangensis]|uniref:sigma factor n=1 Tax=Nonomuraea wenchangensis TaxID=568860 RepID=UPI0033FA275B